jgi:hypothetical protein
MKIKIVYKIVLLILLLFVSFSSAQTISGVFNAVGGKQTNSTHNLSFTIGESLIGYSDNSSTKNYTGFWYTLNENLTTNVKDQNFIPAEFRLEQNYPNPFNPSTVIKFAVSEKSMTTLKVYDIIGREIATLINEERDAGWYEQSFDASALSSGIYIYRLTAGSKVFSKKMMLIK